MGKNNEAVGSTISAVHIFFFFFFFGFIFVSHENLLSNFDNNMQEKNLKREIALGKLISNASNKVFFHNSMEIRSFKMES